MGAPTTPFHSIRLSPYKIEELIVKLEETNPTVIETVNAEEVQKSILI